MKLLHVDSSILGPHSVSRILSAEIVDQQLRLYPGLEIIYRDLAADPLMHLSPAHIAAFHGAPPNDGAVEADIADGGRVLDELFAASILVIGAPMYNFAISSQLKAWIDPAGCRGTHLSLHGERGSGKPPAQGQKSDHRILSRGLLRAGFARGFPRPSGKLPEGGARFHRHHGRDHHPRREYREGGRCPERRSCRGAPPNPSPRRMT